MPSYYIPYEPPTDCLFCHREVRRGEEHQIYLIAPDGSVSWGCRFPIQVSYPTKKFYIEDIK